MDFSNGFYGEVQKTKYFNASFIQIIVSRNTSIGLKICVTNTLKDRVKL